ncbi:MAG: hypothetical protein C0434_12105 [Xanthomonadaceae bacterium]|nr:hypothetical protein [Xanthomonadaceae bacterium]
MTDHKHDLGAMGEGLASWQLATVMNGEAVRETMRGEGIGALDLQVKVPVMFPTKTHHQIAVQVKAGKSFATWTPTKNRWRFNNIDRGHIEKWRGSNQPTLLLWVRMDPRTKVYWKFVGPTTPLAALSFSEHHTLTPAARFEIERLLQMYRMPRTAVPKITVPKMAGVIAVRNWAAPKFQKIRGTHECPLGTVIISNYVWRHLTRITRTQSHVVDSLTALPYIKTLLDIRPHQLQTLNQSLTELNGVTKVSRKVLAIYRDVRFSDKGTCVTYVRLDERVTFPSNWRETGLTRGNIRQQLRLESIFRKPT